jgi:nucleoid-associated protein YgaU
MRRWLLVGIFLTALLALSITVSVSLAQGAAQPADTCTGLEPAALQRIQDTCGFDKLQPFPNSACYANETALFSLVTGDIPAVGSIVSLDAVQSIRTGGSGTAIMNVQPASAPDAPFFVIVVGEAELERAEEGEDGVPAYFVRTATGGCTNDVPAAVGIVSRGGEKTVNFTINGASVTQGSTTIFRVLEPGNTLQIITTEGSAIVQTASGPAVVAAGTTSLICLGEPEDTGLDGRANDRSITESCLWTLPRQLTAEEAAYGAAFDQIVNPLGGCPNGGQTITHTVSRGETLARIVNRYSADLRAVAAANNIGNIDAIFPGQQLVIECAIDTGRSTIAPRAPFPTAIPPVQPRPGS